MSYNIPPKVRASIQLHRPALLAVVENAVNISFSNANRICAGNAGEVDKVLQFFIDGIAMIEDGFNHILQPDGIKVSIAAIFTHQTPYVEFQTNVMPTPERCELADLCVLSSYGELLDDPAKGLGNAIFFQAKQKFNAPLRDTQRQLYENSKGFQYNRPRVLRSILPDYREFPPKNESVLAYWELRPVSTLSRWSHSPRSPEQFCKTFVDFLSADCGYGFRAPRNLEFSWSRIIFDLVEVTVQSTVTRRILNVRVKQKQKRLRGIGTVVRQILNRSGGAKSPFVVRNSLANILGYFSPKLGEMGAKIEEAPNMLDEIASLTDEDESEKGGGDGAPPLGDVRSFYDGDDSGAGNLIFVHFDSIKG